MHAPVTRHRSAPAAAAIVLAFLLVLLSLVTSLAPAHAASTSGESARSPKAGVASIRYAVKDPAKIAALNASWTYNWATSAPEQAPGVEFVPMIHRSQFVTDANIEALTAGRVSGQYRHLLAFNEPDIADQANMSVAEALALWPRLESTGLRLSSPATATPGPWLDQFMTEAAAGGHRVDFLALHFYQDFTRPHAVAELRWTLEQVYAKHRKPIWITELGAVDIRDWGIPMHAAPTQAAADTYIREVRAMLDSLPFVERYAWFLDYSASDDFTSLYDGTGTMTSQGVAFRDGVAGTAASAVVPQPGSYRLVNRHLATSSLHLTGDVYSAHGSARTVVSSPTAWNRTEQRWQLTPAGGGYYYVTSLHDTSLALQATREGYLGIPGVSHVAATPRLWSSDEQLWSVRPTGDGYFRLLNKTSGAALQSTGERYLSFGDVFRSVTSPSSWNGLDQQWSLVPS